MAAMLAGAAAGTGSTSETLVVHQVHTGSSGTIRLRAAGGKLVRTALDASSARWKPHGPADGQHGGH
jgi:hypothetical protein